jgi:hypothetical protein
VSSLYAQITLLNENFSSGIPATWAVVDGDGLTPHDDVAEFTSAWISFESDDTTAASTSYYDTTGQSEDYLILPKLSLMAFSKLVWSARSVDASYPDSYYVLISTTDSLTASFTDTLRTVIAETYLWNTYSILLDTAGYASQDVYIAFRNFTTDGFILELDDIKVLSDDNAFLAEPGVLNLTVFPNPTVEIVNVHHNLTGSLRHEVLDSRGRILLQSDADSFSVSGLSPGIYLLRSYSGAFVAENRFIKL